MDDEIFVPSGWSRSVINGRIVYITAAPHSVKIYSLADLAVYHRKGRFLEVLEDQLVFSRKRKKKEKKFTTSKLALSVVSPRTVKEGDDSNPWQSYRSAVISGQDDTENYQMLQEEESDFSIDNNMLDQCSSNKLLPSILDKSVTVQEKKKDVKKKLDDEHARLTEAVEKLTIDPQRKLDHKSVLEDAARRLNEARLRKLHSGDTKNVDDLKI